MGTRLVVVSRDDVTNVAIAAGLLLLRVTECHGRIITMEVLLRVLVVEPACRLKIYQQHAEAN